MGTYDGTDPDCRCGGPSKEALYAETTKQALRALGILKKEEDTRCPTCGRSLEGQIMKQVHRPACPQAM